MEQMLARCGNRCDLCPAFDGNITTEADKQTVSEKFSKYFGFPVPPETIGCVGCLNEGKQVNPNCEIRACVVEKGIDNCAHCDDFVCAKLQPAIDFIDTYVKDTSNIPAADYRSYIEPFLCKDRLLAIRNGIIHE